jgi:tripartite-type tricarboxylate transporter receptor subunit TctC
LKFGTMMRAVGALSLALAFAAPSWAQQGKAAPTTAEQRVAQFYRGNVLDLYIGFSVGGGYDVYARLVARHLGKHIPGHPTVVPINMDGAGSLKVANWLYNVAPKDGSAIGTFSRGVPFEPLIGNRESARFDATKFTWIGSTTNEVSVCVTWKRTGIQKFEDVYRQELIVGGTGSGADADVFPKVIKGVLGARFKLVSGYPGGNDIEFAMERGEVDGRCGWSWSSILSQKKAWLDNGTIRPLLQLALKKHPDLPNLPLVMDLARNEEERQIFKLIFVRGALGRPYMAPPGIPAERAAALRKAFDEMVKDPAFLAEAKRSRLEITPISGEELQHLLVDVYKTPPAIVDKTRTYLQ